MENPLWRPLIGKSRKNKKKNISVLVIHSSADLFSKQLLHVRNGLSLCGPLFVICVITHVCTIKYIFRVNE